MKKQTSLMLAPDIAALIHVVRDRRIILDKDLAAVYGATTKRFNEQYRRNLERFPDDFAFQITRGEWAALKSQVNLSQALPNLRSQNATSSWHGGRRYIPVAFTEHGALMAANILSSPRALAMSVYVIRAFVKMREDLAVDSLILKRLAEIDKTLLIHDAALREIFQKIRPLLEPPAVPPKPEIGFHVKEDALPYRIRRRART